MSHNLNNAVAVIGIDIGKNSFHVVGLDSRNAIVLRQKWSRGQIEARLANMPPCLIGMEACVGAHHLSRKLGTLGHDARLMPAKYVRPYSKGQKNDFRDAWVVLIKPQSWERHGLKPWIEAAKKRLHRNVLAIALANKLARIAWSVLARGRSFEARPVMASAELTVTCRGLREDETRWRLGLPGACQHW
jgi:transposase